MMLGSSCSPCCVSCDSLVSRFPNQITSQITSINADVFGNTAACESQLRATEPFSWWYSGPVNTVGPFFQVAVPRAALDGRACENCRWRVDFPSAAGTFFAGDFVRVDIECSVIGGQLSLSSFAEARLRGTRFFTITGLFLPNFQSVSAAGLQSATTLRGVMYTQTSGCRGSADIQIAWPGLNPLP
jgi:hypothetical protein